MAQQTQGALGGAAQGAMSGAAMGSIVPGVGTAFGAVVGGIMGGLSGIMGSNAEAKAREAHNKQVEANIKNNIIEANYATAEAVRQQTMLQDSAIDELMNQRIQQMEASGSVQAAAGETGVSGNSVSTVARAIDAQYGRTAASIMTNVENEFMALETQKEAIVRQANAKSKSIAATGMPAGTSGFADMLNILGGVAKGAAEGYGIYNTYSKFASAAK
ncbi:virion core protein, T7 gp14 family [Chromobacterium haemolyticum]|uniref:virion core protein, T7 gp14 family n=1 Tax=Chromobacterium haemolyticum TaxID=394935 RepID=UPI0009D9B65D|nr:hypothetical protein [Chromobacterium haemolyticum]OQS44859.1 hypothetical protein B0T39_01015 [Chromobacterium haemolyticum]